MSVQLFEEMTQCHIQPSLVTQNALLSVALTQAPRGIIVSRMRSIDMDMSARSKSEPDDHGMKWNNGQLLYIIMT